MATTVGDYSVIRSELLDGLDEARDYYQRKLAGAHKIHQFSTPITIVFEREGTHLYSREPQDGEEIAPQLLVQRQLSPGKLEKRIFDVARARLMDHVLPAISRYTVAVPGTGPRGREKLLIHGARLPSGHYVRVILRPGPGSAWTCVSAFPVSTDEWRQAGRAKRAKWPP